MKKTYLVLLLLIQNFIFAQTTNDSLNLLKIGDYAPNFELITFTGDTFKLSQELQKQKVVIVFYRGAWCPFCNKHLAALQDSLYLIQEKATVIAISPEINSSMEKIKEKNKINFAVASDTNYTVMNSYAVAFKLDEFTVKKLKLIGLNIEEANGNKDNILPVPATFVIEQNGKISYIHFNENYKKRSSVKEILNHL